MDVLEIENENSGAPPKKKLEPWRSQATPANNSKNGKKRQIFFKRSCRSLGLITS